MAFPAGFATMKISLRPFQEFSYEYLGWLNDPEINQYTSRGVYPVTEAEAREYVASCQSKERIVWAIFTNRHIGNISLQRIDLLNLTAELAILIGEKSALGKGYGYQAASQACRHGFSILGLNRIYCGTHEDNTGMRKLAERLGMKEEGRSRAAFFRNGKYSDIVHYGVLEEEFSA